MFENITKTIGSTPLIRINKINKSNSTIFAKMEAFNPCGSVKDRIALAMIEAAERDGRLVKEGEIIEPTSGNTGIGLAFISAAKGYKLTLVMPESMSQERRALLKIFGAKLILTPAAGGMKGAIEKAKELISQNPSAIMLDQFANPANPQVHRETTAKEIWQDTEVDIFVSGVGTGGTITGVGEFLKEQNPNVKIIAVEPSGSPVLSGKEPGPHKIQGIGAGFVPKVLNIEIIDDVVCVDDADAFKMTRLLAVKEGILAGISSGAAMFAALQVAKQNENKTIVVVLPDTGERYISTDLFGVSNENK